MDMDGLFFFKSPHEATYLSMYALQDNAFLKENLKSMYLHACLCTFSWIIIQVSSLEFILMKSFLVIVSVRKECQ